VGQDPGEERDPAAVGVAEPGAELPEQPVVGGGERDFAGGGATP
jgi:hypothetical protein